MIVDPLGPSRRILAARIALRDVVGDAAWPAWDKAGLALEDRSELRGEAHDPGAGWRMLLPAVIAGMDLEGAMAAAGAELP